MPGGAINITIGANAQQLTQAAAQATQSLSGLTAGLTAAGNAATAAGRSIGGLAPFTRPSLQGLTLLGSAANNAGRGLGTIPPAAAAAGRSLAQTGAGANQAGNALNNLGRVAQDLPFGFVGIQNNLNPLLESFQRLQASTGSTRGALRALAGSLIGVGGIGFALSAVSAAILIYQNGIAGFNRKTKEAKDAADELAKALESTRTAANVEFGAIGGIQGQITQVQALAKAISDETRTQQERGNALSRLQGISKEYFGSIQLTKTGLQALTKASNEYIEAITRQAIVEELKGEIGKIGAAYLKQREAVQVLRDSIKQFVADKGLETKFDANGRAIFDFTGKNAKAQSELRKMNAQLTLQEQVLQPLSQRFGELRNALTDATFSLLGFKKTSGNGDNDKKAIDLLKQRIDALKTLRDEQGLSTSQQREFVQLQVELLQRDGVKLGFTAQEVNDRIDELIRSTRFGRELESSPIIVPVILQPKPVIDVAGATIPDGIPEDYADSVTEKLRKATQTAVDKGIAIDFGTAIGDSLSAFSEGIANAAIGAGDIGDAFTGAFQAIGSAFQSFGKALIAYGLASDALKKTISNPYIGIAAGIALIAAGALLKKSIGNTPGFADGVTNFTGGRALIGERGPEILTLPTGSNITPLSPFQETRQPLPSLFARGDDLYLVYNRTAGRRRRV